MSNLVVYGIYCSQPWGIKCNNFRHIALVTSSGAQQAKQGSPAAETCAKEALLGRRAVPGMVLRQVLRTSFTPSAQSTRHRHGSVRTRRAKAKTRSTTVQSKLRGCCDRRTCCVQFESQSPELYSAPRVVRLEHTLHAYQYDGGRHLRRMCIGRNRRLS